MYYLIISRQCPSMQQELATALHGRRDIRVILDRRYGQRRVDAEPTSAEHRRRRDRRRPGMQLPGKRA
jgi:hypothetical protein